MHLHLLARPSPSTIGAALETRPASRSWTRHLPLFGPVGLCTGVALVLALRALPLTGGARLLFAACVAVNVGLLALSTWSSVLGATISVGKRRTTRIDGRR